MSRVPDESESPGGTGEAEAPGPPDSFRWVLPGASLELIRPVVVGILNLTPDSFSDGGALPSLQAALDQGRRLLEEGAGVLDVGGESTRPGAAQVSPEVELDRVLPWIRGARSLGLGPISVDTRKAEVAREALRAGAQIVNDVSGLGFDPEMAGVVAQARAGLILSHMRGTPETMTKETDYDDVVSDVRRELGSSLNRAEESGIARERIVVDPGIGFAKTGSQSRRLLRELGSLQALGRPILVGPSRKSFIGEVTGVPPQERGPGTIAACVIALMEGARLFRVHDVAPMVQALTVAEAIMRPQR